MTVVTIFVLKFNSEFKINFYKYVYEDSISFAKINNWYKSKFGSSLPFSDYFEEVVKLRKLSIQSISGIITTNYDMETLKQRLSIPKKVCKTTDSIISRLSNMCYRVECKGKRL